MKLALQSWATPLVAGAFLLSAVTGILIFFHLDTGLNKEAHEWLGWAMVIGVAVHLAVNFKAFKKRFTQPVSLAIVGVFALLLLGSFIPLEEEGEHGGPPMRVAMESLTSAPLSAVAGIARKDVDTLIADLQADGIAVQSSSQSIHDLSGGEREEEMELLSRILR